MCVCTTEPLFYTLEIYTTLQILYFNITTNNIESPCIISQLQISGKHFCLGFTRVKRCVCVCVWNSKRRREGEECKLFATCLLHWVRCWDFRNEYDKILILKIKKLSLSLFNGNINVQLWGQNSDCNLTPVLLAFVEDLADSSQLCLSVCCA